MLRGFPFQVDLTSGLLWRVSLLLRGCRARRRLCLTSGHLSATCAGQDSPASLFYRISIREVLQWILFTDPVPFASVRPTPIPLMSCTSYTALLSPPFLICSDLAFSFHNRLLTCHQEHHTIGAPSSIPNSVQRILALSSLSVVHKS